MRELRGQLLPYRLGAPTDHNRPERTELEMELRERLVKAETFEQMEQFLLEAEEKTWAKQY